MARHTRDGLVTDFAPDPATNRLTDTLGSGLLAYDVFGNLVRFPSSRAVQSAERLSFDLAGRQTRYRDSAVDKRYLYDGGGERVARLVAGGGALQSAVGTSLPPATVGRPYRTGLDVSGGTPPYSWSVAAGSLPPGVALDADEGALAGTPVTIGRFSFTLLVRDAAGASLWRPVTLQVGKSLFYPLTPCRLLDTRDRAAGGALVGGETRLVVPAGKCGIPSDADALVANVTLTGASARAQVTLFPEGVALPGVLPATVHAAPGITRAGAAIVTLGSASSFRILSDLPPGASLHVIVDVAGYFGPASGGSSTSVSAAAGWTLSFRDAENRLVLEQFRDAGGTARTRDYYHFSGYQVASTSTLRQETGYRFYVSDHLGTPRLVTSATGTIVATYKYRPFGEEITGPASGPHFCAMEKDASSGNHYDHARYLRTVRARFLSPDVLSGTPDDPASWNRYTYARNNPLKYVDPDGNAPLDAKDVPGIVADTAIGALDDVGLAVATPVLLLEAGILNNNMRQVAAGGALLAASAAIEGASLIRAAGSSMGFSLGLLAPDDTAAAAAGFARNAAGDFVTPAGQPMTSHAVERAITPPVGRAPMTGAEVDQILQTGATRLTATNLKEGTITIQAKGMPGKPQVAVSYTTGRVTTVIKNTVKPTSTVCTPASQACQAVAK